MYNLEDKLRESNYKISMSDLMKILDNVNKWIESYHGVYEESKIGRASCRERV